MITSRNSTSFLGGLTVGEQMMAVCVQDCCETDTALTWALDLDATLDVIEQHAQPPESRFPVGSPCRWIKAIDVAVHIVLPELIEKYAPRLAAALRNTSPRWGRSWRHCKTASSK